MSKIVESYKLVSGGKKFATRSTVHKMQFEGFFEATYSKFIVFFFFLSSKPRNLYLGENTKERFHHLLLERERVQILSFTTTADKILEYHLMHYSFIMKMASTDITNWAVTRKAVSVTVIT